MPCGVRSDIFVSFLGPAFSIMAFRELILAYLFIDSTVHLELVTAP